MLREPGNIPSYHNHTTIKLHVLQASPPGELERVTEACKVATNEVAMTTAVAGVVCGTQCIESCDCCLLYTHTGTRARAVGQTTLTLIVSSVCGRLPSITLCQLSGENSVSISASHRALPYMYLVWSGH